MFGFHHSAAYAPGSGLNPLMETASSKPADSMGTKLLGLGGLAALGAGAFEVMKHGGFSKVVKDVESMTKNVFDGKGFTAKGGSSSAGKSASSSKSVAGAAEKKAVSATKPGGSSFFNSLGDVAGNPLKAMSKLGKPVEGLAGDLEGVGAGALGDVGAVAPEVGGAAAAVGSEAAAVAPEVGVAALAL